MSPDWTAEHFSPLIGQAFFPGASPMVELELQSVTQARGGARDMRQGFTLLFRGPTQPVLPQGIQSLRHPAFGEAGIFLVPVGADEHGTLYEAVFN